MKKQKFGQVLYSSEELLLIKYYFVKLDSRLSQTSFLTVKTEIMNSSKELKNIRWIFRCPHSHDFLVRYIQFFTHILVFLLFCWKCEHKVFSCINLETLTFWTVLLSSQCYFESVCKALMISWKEFLVWFGLYLSKKNMFFFKSLRHESKNKNEPWVENIFR